MLISESVPLATTHIRAQIREGDFTNVTSGVCPGFLQGNLIILDSEYADEFLAFCDLNPKSCPVIGVSKPGDPTIPVLGGDIDIRNDVPGYHVFEQGQFVREVSTISNLWNQSSVAIVLGCSFTFEEALISAGYSVRNVELGLNVSMYETTIATKSTEHFGGNTVVSMRPFKRDLVESIIAITSRFPQAHGAPIHVGYPSEIGIHNIQKPDYGDAVPLYDDEVPIFWGCGVTSQRVARNAKLPLLITHAPGKMLITDIPGE